MPIYDTVVSKALMGDVRADDWALWRERFSGPAGVELAERANAVAAEAGVRTMSVLRIVDVVVWMRHRGWAESEELSGFADLPPPASPSPEAPG